MRTSMTRTGEWTQVKALLVKYGWNDFWEVYGAVLSGSFLLMFEDMAAQMNSAEFSKSIEKSKAGYNTDDYQLVKKTRRKSRKFSKD